MRCLIRPGGDADWQYADVVGAGAHRVQIDLGAGRSMPGGAHEVELRIAADEALLQRHCDSQEPISLMIPPGSHGLGLIGGRGYVFSVKDGIAVVHIAGGRRVAGDGP